MSYFEFRQLVESCVPAWVPFIVPIVALAVFALSQAFKAQEPRQ